MVMSEPKVIEYKIFLDVITLCVPLRVCDLTLSLQVIHGAHGLRPAEPVLQFVANNYAYFQGGVFYVSAHNYHFLQGAEEEIREVCSYCEVHSKCPSGSKALTMIRLGTRTHYAVYSDHD